MKNKYVLLCLREVVLICKISKSKIYRDMKDGLFPTPLRLGSNCVRWNSNDIDNWIEGLSY